MQKNFQLNPPCRFHILVRDWATGPPFEVFKLCYRKLESLIHPSSSLHPGMPHPSYYIWALSLHSSMSHPIRCTWVCHTPLAAVDPLVHSCMPHPSRYIRAGCHTPFAALWCITPLSLHLDMPHPSCFTQL